MKARTFRLICFPVVAIIVALLIAVNIAAGIFNEAITNVLCGTGVDFSGEQTQETLRQSDALCRTLGEDSIVLLKNSETDGEAALPLRSTETKVNLFGISAYDPTNAASFDGFLMKGIGSGSSTISENKAVTLQDALTQNGIEYNTDLEALYDSFEFNRTSDADNCYLLAEPDIESVRAGIDSAKAYSDVAIVVFSRLGGENVGEQPKTQPDNPDKTYLDISDDEQALLDLVTDNFGKVIVLLNTSNAMHCGFLEDDGVDAAMYVGLTGQSGATAIGELLKGVTLDGTRISPSGKLSDLYSYDPNNDPAFANTEMTNTGTDNTGINIHYMENIYFGYRWYETADAEGYFDDVSNEYGTGYDGVVQYPFGYGLSYTDFEWAVESVSLADGGSITDGNKNDEIEVSVIVTNTGDYPGKDVVELYYTPEYIDGEVEKAEVNLLDFAKTSLLEPGESERLTLTFTPYDMASFDAYNANHNDYATWELDAGTYSISLRTDSHTVADCDNAVISYNLPEDVIYTEDPVTGEEVVTRFTGSTAYAGVPIDGSTVGASTNYLSRADLSGTFPREKAQAPTNRTEVLRGATYEYDGYDTETMPTQGADNGDDALMLTYTDGNGDLQYDYDLFATLSDYDAPEWTTLLNQITVSELITLVQQGGFRTEEIASIGKPRLNDYDGPAGFNTNSLTGSWGGEMDTESWTAYPCECLIGCSWNKTLLLQLGLSMGREAATTGISGWYAPGINLHRTNYTSRNYEYYSEDPVLSGNLAANVIRGAKINGLYCYMKHFVVSESGPNGRDWNTWLTEQALRELYLKPFEIAVKEGEANAVMSSFNGLGSTWAGGNHALLTDILRNEWGFEGSVVSDWTMGGPTGGSLVGNAPNGGMSTTQGVRAGNDLMLAPYGVVLGGALSSGNATDVDRARNAAHNVIFTLVDTIHFNRTFDDSELDSELTVDVDVANRAQVFPWWIPVLVAVEVLIVAGCAVWVVFAIRKKDKPAA